MIGIRQKEVPVLVPPMEPSIVAKNQPAMTISTEVIQTSQAIKAPTIQYFIASTTPYNTETNRTP